MSFQNDDRAKLPIQIRLFWMRRWRSYSEYFEYLEQRAALFFRKARVSCSDFVFENINNWWCWVLYSSQTRGRYKSCPANYILCQDFTRSNAYAYQTTFSEVCFDPDASAPPPPLYGIYQYVLLYIAHLILNRPQARSKLHLHVECRKNYLYYYS